MSKLHNPSRAAEARRRREKKRNQLEDLRQLATAPGASSSLKREYEAAFERHTKFLKTERTRVATWRKNWPLIVKRKFLMLLRKQNGIRKLKKHHM